MINKLRCLLWLLIPFLTLIHGYCESSVKLCYAPRIVLSETERFGRLSKSLWTTWFAGKRRKVSVVSGRRRKPRLMAIVQALVAMIKDRRWKCFYQMATFGQWNAAILQTSRYVLSFNPEISFPLRSDSRLTFKNCFSKFDSNHFPSPPRQLPRSPSIKLFVILTQPLTTSKISGGFCLFEFFREENTKTIAPRFTVCFQNCGDFNAFVLINCPGRNENSREQLCVPTCFDIFYDFLLLFTF